MRSQTSEAENKASNKTLKEGMLKLIEEINTVVPKVSVDVLMMI
jgi:hypothetical protein